MEVHAHSHTTADPDPSTSSGHRGRKKWTHYFWEFLMLFLAVFCGFLAENFREHKVESNRAKELAISFYDELKGDSLAFHTVLENRLRKNTALIYLKKYFRDSSLVNCSKTFAVNFCYGFATYSPSIFEPRDAILEQLKNSGSLRYFKSAEFQKLTGELSVDIATLRSRNQTELSFVMEQLLPFLIQHNDQDWFDKLGANGNSYLVDVIRKYELGNEEIPFRFNKPDNFDRSAATNLIGVYQLIFLGSLRKQYRDYENLNSKLLETLRKEYKIK